MKDTTKTVCQRNSTETAQQNFLKLCSNEGHNAIAGHLCLELPFIVYSILKQCWSVGYVSLLTLSFIKLAKLKHNLFSLQQLIWIPLT